MKFRTEISVRPFRRPIGYGNAVLTLGSCFADAMRDRLREAKFRAAGNFAGPLYNPAAIDRVVRRAAEGGPYAAEELQRGADGCYFHFDTHTLAADPDPVRALTRCNEAREALRTHLEASSHVVATFGTAWAYRLRETGEVVANCHREPASRFVRELLRPEEIAGEWSQLLEGPLAGREVILSVSPVRHPGDGAEAGSLSKAVLRVAADLIAQRFERVTYFPAFEIMVDDLRDYRFYAADLVHPSAEAVAYIWEHFSRAALTTEAQRLAAEVERLLRVAGHRPRNPASSAWKELCGRTLRSMAALQMRERIDFSAEIAYLEGILSR